MWIVLNPKKARRFTTQGINLYKGAPTAFIQPDTSMEVMAAINRAIVEGRIYSVEGNEMDGLTIPDQAQITNINMTEVDSSGSTTVIRNDEGKIIGTVLTMPDEDGNVNKKKTHQQNIILTGIQDLPIDEVEEES